MSFKVGTIVQVKKDLCSTTDVFATNSMHQYSGSILQIGQVHVHSTNYIPFYGLKTLNGEIIGRPGINSWACTGYWLWLEEWLEAVVEFRKPKKINFRFKGLSK